MESLSIGVGLPRAKFHSASRARGADPYEGGSFHVDVEAVGVRVEREVNMLEYEWQQMAEFFSDLAASWKGWDGTKTWRSLERDLAIDATADHTGHCHLALTVQDGPVWSWRFVATGFAVEAGEELRSLAKEVRAWTSA